MQMHLASKFDSISLKLFGILFFLNYSISISYSQQVENNRNYKLDTLQVEGYFIKVIPKKEFKIKSDILTFDNHDFWIFLPKDKLYLIKHFDDLKKEKCYSDSIYLPCTSHDFNDFNYYLFGNNLTPPQECIWPLKDDKTSPYKSKNYKGNFLFVFECKALWLHTQVSENDTKGFGSFIKSKFEPNNEIDIYLYFKTIEINSNLKNLLVNYSLK